MPTDPAIRPEAGAAAGAMGEERRVIGGVIPVIAGAIEEMVLGGLGHWVIGRPDAGHGGDIGEFADAGVGDIGEAVAIGVIIEAGIDDARPLPHFAIRTEGGVHDLSVWVDDGRCGGKLGQDMPFSVLHRIGKAGGKRREALSVEKLSDASRPCQRKICRVTRP
jgi:hypothetical protein